MNDPAPKPTLTVIQSSIQDTQNSADDLAESIPTPTINPVDALRDMRLEKSLNKMLIGKLQPFGVTLKDATAKDRYGGIKHQYTLAEGPELKFALLQIPRWIIGNNNNVGSLVPLGSAFRDEIVRIISQRQEAGSFGLRRVLRDWEQHYNIQVQFVPWQYIKDLNEGNFEPGEILELKLKQQAKQNQTPADRDQEVKSPLVFISYSHKDKEWLEELQLQLKPRLRLEDSDFSVWDDTQIQAGDKWGEEIENALGAASVGVLLVSKHFLGSDFIYNNELPPLMAAAEKQNMKILWILVSECAYDTLNLSKFQAAHDLEKPLLELKEKSSAELDRVLNSIGQEIEKAAKALKK